LERALSRVEDLSADLAYKATILAISASNEGPRKGFVRFAKTPGKKGWPSLTHDLRGSRETRIAFDQCVVGRLGIAINEVVAREQHAPVHVGLMFLTRGVEPPAILGVAPDLIGRMRR